MLYNNMNFELIVAMTNNNIIGFNDRIPWHLPEDLKRFRDLTLNSVIVMGRKTFDSLPNKQPLKDRIHIVLTRNLCSAFANASHNGTIQFSMLHGSYRSYIDNVIYIDEENVFDLLKKYSDKKIFIIGGSEIYKMFFNYCNKLYITVIEEDIEGNIYFPYHLDEIKKKYKLIEESNIYVSKNNIKYKYYTFDKY